MYNESMPAPLNMPQAGATLFVGNLPFKATDEEIAFAFQAYGCTSAAMQRHEDSGRTKGWALVTVSVDPALAIAGTHDTEFQGRKLLVREDRGPTAKTERPPRARKAKAERAPRPPREEQPEPEPSNTIFVGNLPWGVDSAQLAAFFQGSLTAEVQTRHDGRSSGFALVSYESIEHAQYAIQTMNGQDIGGRACVCRYDRG